MNEKKLPLSYIEISKSNLLHNFKSLKKISNPHTKIALAIKGNAYGHGQNEIAKILETYTDYFFVNSFEELQKLRKITKKRCFVLGYVAKANLKEAIKLKPILSFFSIEHLREINKVAGILGIKQEVHIPIDAHLGREGFLEQELIEIFQIIKKLKNIKLGGMYAHFANIEDVGNLSHANKQIKHYENMLKLSEEYGFRLGGKNGLEKHISATSGLLVYETDKGVNSIIRIGIGLYGMWPSDHIKILYKKKFELKPVLSWKTRVAQVKILPAGETVGYGLTYTTDKETKVALIPQGYADGLDRRLSNVGEVLIRGNRCPIIGRVSMNMCTVDVTHVQGVVAEDEVVIIGTQGQEAITAESVAMKISTINYEITTRISPLLPRLVK